MIVINFIISVFTLKMNHLDRPKKKKKAEIMRLAIGSTLKIYID